MVQIIRERPNLLPLINGVKFEPHPEGSISADISEEAAQQFLAVPGYRLAEAAEPAAPAPKAERKPRAAAKEAAEPPAAEPAADAAAEEVF